MGVWRNVKQGAISTVTDLVVSPPVLAQCSVNYSIVVTADASSHGLGAVLIQTQPEGHWRPYIKVSYRHRAMLCTS